MVSSGSNPGLTRAPARTAVSSPTSQLQERRQIPAERTRAPWTAKQSVGAETVLSAFNSWSFKREQPDNREKMLRAISERLAQGAPISFVLYWGKGPRNHVADPEIRCLAYLEALAARIGAIYSPGAQFTLLFTDTHAALNGHAAEAYGAYFDSVIASANPDLFTGCRLSAVLEEAKPALHSSSSDPIPPELLNKLTICASKWSRGGNSAENAALLYYEMNMQERRAVEFCFPESIFVTFNGSDLRPLFPDRIPIFYMYSVKKGVAVKPWFMSSSPCEQDRSAGD